MSQARTISELVESGEFYFICDKSDQNRFIHFTVIKGEPMYYYKKGLVGACIFSKEQAEEFLKCAENDELELVPIEQELAPNWPQA